MMLTEYTAQRAEALNKLILPEIEQPISMRVLWLDLLMSGNIHGSICKDSHSHSFFEIHFVFSGTIRYECDGQIIDLCEGQALLLAPSVTHRYLQSGDNLLKASLAITFSRNKVLPLAFYDTNVNLFDFSDDIPQNINFILKQSENRDIFIPHLISGRIMEVMRSVWNALHIRLPEIGKHATDPRLAVAKQYIKNNQHRMISCKDVARECCLSSKQINRIFKNHTGHSLMEYIIEARVKYAKKLLLQNEYSVKEIAYMLGFENESSFISFFKRHCDSPPGKFRKQYSTSHHA